VLHVLGQDGCRILVVHQLHNLLAAPILRQREMLTLLRHPGYDLRVPRGEEDREGSGAAIQVDDLRALHDKLKAARVKILVPPSEVDPAGFGETSPHKYLTCLFEDPDGVILQLDQRVV